MAYRRPCWRPYRRPYRRPYWRPYWRPYRQPYPSSTITTDCPRSNYSAYSYSYSYNTTWNADTYPYNTLTTYYTYTSAHSHSYNAAWNADTYPYNTLTIYCIYTPVSCTDCYLTAVLPLNTHCTYTLITVKFSAACLAAVVQPLVT